MSDEPGALQRTGFRLYRKLSPAVGQRLVRTFKPTYSLGAIALIEFDGKLLALRQAHRAGYSLPGGLIDRGEQPRDAVRREVAEETGIDIDPGDLVTVVFDPRVRHADVIFRVVCDREPEVTVASEAYDHAWLDLVGWPEADYATARILKAVRAASTVPQPGRLSAQ
ncbi:NUDIX domain-containing protein [Yimella sp. RIT 621]|uniref:ADP-ribose pyrophosphatase YjhB (NUDIX family) n=1 Tax=Yimella lutea TaxID=587872 RepID=A0A542EBK8_9MICO|nr:MULTISPECIES: NUDIX domain-containing protein [Yimella]RYG77354.1 NUDIX domain-containing protein [Yimella sp. RIT 621]TQJ12732.1 ADP-ribose pyrophosphatase YjhB (NUDIX family) [Yimella lutea]